MAVPVGSYKLLHSSEVELGPNWASCSEYFSGIFDSYYTDEEVESHFLSTKSIVLGVSTKVFQGRIAVASNLRLRRHPKSRRIWMLNLAWNPIDSGAINRNWYGADPLTKVNPAGAADPTDPDSWDPVLLRRPSMSREGRPLAYYQGGFNGYAHSKIVSDATAMGGARQPVTNSAFVPVANAPGAITSASNWLLRVLTKVPINYTDLTKFEYSTNSGPVSITHKGLTVVFPTHCLFCDGITLGEQKVNNEHAWSIEIAFREKYHADDNTVGGFVDKFLDVGYDLRAITGVDKDEAGNTITIPNSRLRRKLDASGLALTSQIMLNGNGGELSMPVAPGSPPKYGYWRYPHQMDWGAFPYFSRIITPTP